MSDKSAEIVRLLMDCARMSGQAAVLKQQLDAGLITKDEATQSLKALAPKARESMEEHTCAGCGTEPVKPWYNRNYCTGCLDVRSCGDVDRDKLARDESGKNGPGTWVNPDDAPAAIKALWGEACTDNLRQEEAEHIGYESEPETKHTGFAVGDRVVCGGPGDGETGQLVITTTHPMESWTVALGDGRRFYTTDPNMLTPAPAEDAPKHPKQSALIDTLAAMDSTQDYTIPMGREMAEQYAAVAQPQHTHTAEFELPDGHRCSIPEPGDGWEVGETTQKPEWPASYVLGADVNTGEISTIDKVAFRVHHEAGRCWLADMGPNVLEPGVARIVSVTRWKRKPTVVLNPRRGEIAYTDSLSKLRDHCPSLQPLQGKWPDRHVGGGSKVR
jgi:hypothetical protein